jgi:Glycosyl transferase family 8
VQHIGRDQYNPRDSLPGGYHGNIATNVECLGCWRRPIRCRLDGRATNRLNSDSQLSQRANSRISKVVDKPRPAGAGIDVAPSQMLTCAASETFIRSRPKSLYQNMKKKGPLRRTLGRVKQRLLDEWPYIPMRQKAARIAQMARQSLSDAPKVICDNNGRFEVHILCGERHADMGMWASWSLLRFFPPSQLWVHSDGTLTEESLDRWNQVIAGVKYVAPDAGNHAWSKSAIAGCPNLNEFRRVAFYAAKFTDFHLFGQSEKILIIDSDILCFKPPKEIFPLVDAAGAVFAYNTQFDDAYVADVEDIERIIGVAPPTRFNSGFMVMSRFDEADYLRMENYMERLRSYTSHNPWTHLYTEQTLFGIAAALSGVAKPLSNSYGVTRGRKVSSAVVRHYVGLPSVRPRFYTEGVTEILGAGFRNTNAA